MFNHSATEKTNLPNQTLSASGIPNGLLNSSICGNDIGVMSAPYRILVNNPLLSSSVSPLRTLAQQRRELSIVGVPQFGGHTGKPHLLAFGSFVLLRLSFSGLYRREKRVAARRGVHIA